MQIQVLMKDVPDDGLAEDTITCHGRWLHDNRDGHNEKNDWTSVFPMSSPLKPNKKSQNHMCNVFTVYV